MAVVSLAVGLRSVFFVLGCVIIAAVIYTIVTDGLPFRLELLTPWMATTLIDFYINIVAIGTWIVYKESNWMSRILWIVLLLGLGSIATCAYIVLQFVKLSPKKSSEDPIFYVLLRDRKEDGAEPNRLLSVVTARVLFGALGCLMLGTLIYTISADGSPFRKDVLTPWLSTTLIDFYINIVALSVWVAYKESSWIRASLWIVLLICTGRMNMHSPPSIARIKCIIFLTGIFISTCVYIVLQLFHLSYKDPVHLVLFNGNNRAENGYEIAFSRDNGTMAAV